MTGAWRGGLQFGQAIDVGTNATLSQGLNVIGSAATFSKGVWNQVVAATPNDGAWLMVYIETQNSASSYVAIDVGIGASGAEVTIAANLICSLTANHAARYLLPLAIPAGTRIAARMSGNQANDAVLVGFTILGDVANSVGTGGMIDTYGFQPTANIGTAVDPGATANTKGAYSTISSSLTSDLSGFIVAFDTQGTTTGSVGPTTWLVDFAVGAVGAEQVFIPNMLLAGVATSGFSMIFDQTMPYLPIQMSVGTRVSVRAQCSTNVSPDRLFGVTLYGVRQ